MPEKKKVYKVPQEYPTVQDACAALWMAGAWGARIVVDTGGTVKSLTYDAASALYCHNTPENEAKAKVAWAAAYEALPAVKAKAKTGKTLESLGYEEAKKAYGLSAGSETKIIRALVEDFTGAKKVLNMAFSPQVTADLHAVYGVSHAEILAETLADTLLHESCYGSPGWFGVTFQMEDCGAKTYKVPQEFGTIQDAITAMLKDAKLDGSPVNKNGRIYPASLWDKIAVDYAKKHSETVCAVVAHPSKYLSYLGHVEAGITKEQVGKLLGYKASDFTQVDPFLAGHLPPGGLPKIDLSIKTTEIDASKKTFTPVFTFVYDKDHPPSGPFKCVNPLIPGGVVVGPVNTLEEAEVEWNKQAEVYKQCGPKAFKEYLGFKKEHPDVDLTPSQASLLAVAPKGVKEQLVSRIVAHAIIANMNKAVGEAMSKDLLAYKSEAVSAPGFPHYGPYVPLHTTPPIPEPEDKEPDTPSDIEAFKGGALKALGGLSPGATSKQRMQIVKLLADTAAHMKDPEAKKEAKTYLFGLAYGAGLPMPAFPSDIAQELMNVQPLPQKSGQISFLGESEKGKAGKPPVGNFGKFLLPKIKAVFPELGEVFMQPGLSITVTCPGAGLTTKGLETLERFGVALKDGPFHVPVGQKAS